MATEDLIGKELLFGPLEVSAEGIVAFSKGINEGSPVHADPATDGFHAHPMYAAAFIIPGTGMIFFQPGGDIRVNRIVHGGIDLHFHRPIRVGDELQTISSLQAVHDKGSGRLIEVAFRVEEPSSGEVVVDGLSSYWERGKKKEGEAKESEAAPDAPAPFAADFERVMDTLDDQSILYAEGSGDRFPIHTDDEFARGVGLPGMIMHGMCTLALSARALIDEIAAGDSGKLTDLGCRFSDMVLPGESLRVLGAADTTGGAGEVGFETHVGSEKKAITEGRARLG